MNLESQRIGGGWIRSQATGCAVPSSHKTLTALVTTAFLVGTGGHSTVDYIVDRHDRGYRFGGIDKVPPRPAVVAHTPLENIAYVRNVLKPGISDLAALVGVSRQAVYDWLSGTQPSADHVSRLEDLSKAARILAAEGLSASAQLIKRPLVGGKSFFELVKEGDSAQSASRLLVQLLRREAEQRQMLNSRLAGRKRPDMSSTDLGSPMLDESV